MKKIKRKIFFYKHILIEILETLCTICLYLEHSDYGMGGRNHYYQHFRSHFNTLKSYSEDLREDFK